MGSSSGPKTSRNGTPGPESGKHLRWTIPSQFAAGNEVQQQILEQLARLGYSENSIFAIKLSLDEALINAIKHGNKLSPKKKVMIEAKLSASRCEITIEDDGPGFDRSSVPDPTAEENLEKCSGRGILLMEAYMNTVTWDRGGRRVTLVKLNNSDATVV